MIKKQLLDAIDAALVDLIKEEFSVLVTNLMTVQDAEVKFRAGLQEGLQAHRIATKCVDEEVAN